MFKFNQDDVVRFEVGMPSGPVQGIGKIKGIGMTGIPALGVNYIIEPLEPGFSERYSYTHMCVFENFLTPIDNENPSRDF